MNVKTLALIATVALTGLYFAHAADEPKAKLDPRIDKLIEQNDQILKNQDDIKKTLNQLSQDLLQLRRRSS